jgi:hypothetical protein
MYQDFKVVYAIEQVLDRKSEVRAQQWESLERFRSLLCQVLLALNEHKHYTEVSKRHYMKYCQSVNLDKVL